MKNKKDLFLIPDSVVIKINLYSHVLHHGKLNAEIDFWSLLLEETSTLVKDLNAEHILYKHTRFTPESILILLFWEMYSYIRLLHDIHIFKCDKILGKCQKEIFRFKQELAQAFYRDKIFYLTTRTFIKQDTFRSQKLGFIASNLDFYVSTDTQNDWIAAEQKLLTLIQQL